MPYELESTTSENPGRWLTKRWVKPIGSGECRILIERLRTVREDEELVDLFHVAGVILAGLKDYDDEPGTATNCRLIVYCEVRYE